MKPPLRRYFYFCPNLKFTSVILFVLICLKVVGQRTEDKLLLNTFNHIKNKDSSENYARQLISIAQKNNDQLFEAQILLAQSFKVYSNGDEIRALSLAHQANKLTSVQDSVTYTKSATMIAFMLNRRGKNLEALNIAFDILRKTDARGWRKQGLGCLNCIADLYRSMGDPKKALPYALLAAKQSKSLADTGMYIYSLSMLSNTYSATSIASPANLNLAAGYLETVLAAPYVNKLSPFDKANYLSNLGRIYRKQNKFTKARVILLQSIAIAKKEKFKGIEKHSLNELMTAEIDQGHYSEAINYANQVLAAQAQAQSSRIQVRDIYHQLSRAYEGLHDYKNALLYTNKSQSITDSLINVDKNKAATELAEKYKADKRLILAASQREEATLERNFIVVFAVVVLLAGIVVYRWFAHKSKRERALLNERNKQLAHLDALKTKFFANISHELRTPLTLIMGPAEQLLNGEQMEAPQRQRHLEAVYRNGKKLLSLVNELLDLGKMEAGTLAVKPKPIDLPWLINIIFQSFASVAAYKNIHYTLSNVIEGPQFVQLDADKFEKIANNLITNAIKFTTARGTVHVIAAINNAMIEFTVTDSGRGIHPKDLPLIFDRYFQGQDEGGVSEGGTGIGLAIAKEFAELMDGSISVQSTWGAGSIFKLAIPQITATTVASAYYNPTPAESADELAGGNGEKLVLLVEDHREMAQYISSIIKPFYRILLADNGLSALDVLKNATNLPDLIISDVMMPDMDGFTLLNQLKHDDAFCRIPVIMLTALGDNQNRLKALNTGVDDYLTKPFIANELLARINNLITNAAQRGNFSKQEEQEFAGLAKQEVNDTESKLTPIAPHISRADLLWLAELEILIRKGIGKSDLNIAMLSYDMALSERQLFRRVKNITGLTPNIYVRTIRLQIAREAIESGRYRTTSEIAYAAGFETPAYFSKLFKEYYGREVNELL